MCNQLGKSSSRPYPFHKTTAEYNREDGEKNGEDFYSLYCKWFEHRGENKNVGKGKERVNSNSVPQH